MDDGYSTHVQTTPLSPGYDIGPDEDRNNVPAQRYCTTLDDGAEDYRAQFMQDGVFTDCLDETPSTFTDNTDMPNVSSNTPDEASYHEVNRRRTFDGHWSARYFVQPDDLAHHGFIYCGPDDKVMCVFCLKTLWHWEEGDSVEKEHKRHYPNCPFVRGKCHHLNVPINSFEALLGLQMKTGKQNLPHHMNYSDRLKTYQNWPKRDVLRPESLAEAGLFYLGEGDQVRCFSCEKVLSNWKPGDDPWCEHARISPGCSYIQSVKGSEFVAAVCSNQSSPDHSQQELSMAGDTMNAVGSGALVTETGSPLGHRSQEAEPIHNVLDVAAQVDKEMKSPTVVAMMTTCDISVERMRERLMHIILTEGPDYTVKTDDFVDLMN
ncbi:hypothetical protein BsWGS_27902 [Bradybaena similaris]